MTRHGTRTNTRDNILNNVKQLLSKEYLQVSALRFFAARCLQQPIFAEQVIVGKSIYAKKRKVDFIIFHPQRWPDCLVIQCKWQASRGSVEEKYPFEVECIADGAFQTIIVLDGNGYSKGAHQWLLAQRNKRQLVDVCNMEQFLQLQTQGEI